MGGANRITNNIMLEIAKGNVTGHSLVNKFGENQSSAANTREDIWDGSSTYVFPSGDADATHVAELTDQAADRGAAIEVQGLNSNWDLVTQTITLDASDSSTLVALSTPLKRVFRMKVNDNVVAAANISVVNVANTVKYATMLAGNNQTLMAIYTVPRAKTAYMISYYATGTRDTARDPNAVNIRLWTRDNENGYAFQLKHSIGMAQGAGKVDHYFTPFFRIPAKSDIKLTGLATDAAGYISAGFDLILVDD